MSRDIFDENEIIDWSVIESYEQEDSNASWAMALNELHKMLDFLLENQGYRGEDLAAKIYKAKARFSNLKGLKRSLEIYNKVFEKYNESVSLLEIQEAERKLKQAVRDVSSKSDFSPPSSLEKFKSYLDYNFDKLKFYRVSLYLLVTIILILVLDNTHFGQKLIHYFAILFNSIIAYLIFAGIIIVLFGILVIGTIIFFGRGK